MTNLNLFRAMRNNRAENDERIAGERMRASLNTLRFIQFIVLFIQLAGQFVQLFFPHNSQLQIPQFVYILMILPFIVEPLYASMKGYIGAIKSDGMFFVIGMIEFGYTAYVIATYLGVINLWVCLGILVLGMIAYYLIAYALYNASFRLSAGRSDDYRDN